MNIDLAVETAKVINFKALSEWGNHFTLERCTEDGFLAFLDVMDVPRVVVEEELWTVQSFLQQLESCPEGGDIVIRSINSLGADCCAILRDLLFGTPDSEQLKYRYMFIGINSRVGLGQNQSEVLAFCTPIDLPLFVQHETMQLGLFSINQMLVGESEEDYKKGDKVYIEKSFYLRGKDNGRLNLGRIPGTIIDTHGPGALKVRRDDDEHSDEYLFSQAMGKVDGVKVKAPDDWKTLYSVWVGPRDLSRTFDRKDARHVADESTNETH